MELPVAQLLQLAITAHQEGKPQDAERLYRSILQTQPGHAGVNHNLGLLAVSAGKVEEALPLFENAYNAKPNLEQFCLSYIDALIMAKQPEKAKQVLEQARKRGIAEEKLSALERRRAAMAKTRNSPSERITDRKTTRQNKGRNYPPQQQLVSLLEHYQKGRFRDAEVLARSISQEFPRHELSWKVLGAVFSATGRIPEAVRANQVAVDLSPQDADAHNNLGSTFLALGRLDEAAKSCREALRLSPNFTAAHVNLGSTLYEQGKFLRAIESYNKALVLNPDCAEIHNNLGLVLKRLGRIDEAHACFESALRLNPEYAAAHVNLGSTFLVLGRLDEAAKSCREALRLSPNFTAAHVNLGSTLHEQGKFLRATESYNKALVLNPDCAEIHHRLGNTLISLGRLNEAEASFRKTLSINPYSLGAYSDLLFLNSSMRFDESKNRRDLQAFSDLVDSQISTPYLNWSKHKSANKLRVGFVSGDFKQHPVAIFLEGLLFQLQSSSIESYAYPTNDFEGDVTDRLKTLFNSWTPLSRKTDKEAAQAIHNDGIDILIDLSGHTGGNRLAIFGWRPAPIQITWLGYFASTGMPQIDYILGDPFVTPQSEAHHFTEEIWQLPESYLCFTPPDQDLAIGSLPALKNGFLTFGCFNNLSRMTDEVVSVRAEILRNVPNSKLFLKDKQLDYQSVRDQVLSRFATHGISSARLLLEGRSTREEYLKCYHRVDIALSPFPYGGGTTSVEGLWMGVPVVTRKGSYFLSHLGESIAHNSKLSDWIAHDNEDYVEKAMRFSSDLNSLGELRHGLREKLLKTPLYDLPRFARHFEEALWKMRESVTF